MKTVLGLAILIILFCGCSELGLDGSDCSEWKLVSETSSTDKSDVNFKKFERCIDGGYQVKYEWYTGSGRLYDTEIYTYYD